MNTPHAPATSTDDPRHEAFRYLDCCTQLIGLARREAGVAAEGLTGTQLARCRELVDQLAAVEAFAERLTTVVAGDRRADLSRMTQHKDTRPVVPGVLFNADWSVAWSRWPGAQLC